MFPEALARGAWRLPGSRGSLVLGASSAWLALACSTPEASTAAGALEPVKQGVVGPESVAAGALQAPPTPGDGLAATPTACEAEELARIASGLEKMPSAKRSAAVAVGILDACPEDELHATHRRSLLRLAGRPAPSEREPLMTPPDATQALFARVCDEGRLAQLDPGVPADARPAHVYATCRWAELDIVDPEEVSAAMGLGVEWAYYPFLRERQVPHPVARALTRVLIFADA